MLTVNQWASLLHLLPTDFEHPEKMEWSIVKALDDFIGILRSKPSIISDYREPQRGEKESQHHHGRAVDCVWPSLDPLQVGDTARSARLFNGLGIYKNEQDAVSFHFDTREERDVHDPALWSGDITHPYDAELGTHIKVITYYAWSVVVEYLKKKVLATSVIVVSVLASFVIYRLTR